MTPASKLIKPILREIRSARVTPPRPRQEGEVSDIVMDAARMMDDVPEAPAVGDAPVDAPAPSMNPDVPEAPDGVASARQAMDEAEADPSVDAQAEGLADNRLDDYDLEAPYQINFNRIDGDESLQAALAEMASRNQDRIQSARRGVVPDEEVRRLSQDMSVREDTLRNVLNREAGDGGISAEQVLAARQMLNASASRLHALATRITRGEATDFDRLDFRRQIAFHQTFQAKFMGARAEIGRALRAFRPMEHMGASDAAERAALLDSTEPHNFERNVARIVASATGPDGAVDIGEVTRAVRPGFLRRLENGFQEWFLGSILSGPTTHLVNFVGSPLMQGMRVAETALAAQIGRVERAGASALGRAPQEGGVEVGEALATVHGFISGATDGMRVAWKAMKEGAPQQDSYVKYEMPPTPAISSEMFDLAGPLGWMSQGLADAVRPAANAAVDLTGTIVRAPMERVITPADELFKTMAYRGDLGRSAMRQAQTEVRLGSLSEADMPQRVRELMEQPTDQMVDEAQAMAINITFQQELGEMGRAVQKGLNRIPFFRVVVPFIKTPTNIFKEGVSRTPLAVGQFASGQFRKDFMSDAAFRQQWLARFGMGMGTSATVALNTHNGMITGAGPPSWEAQQVLRATGWRPYSIRMADGSYQSYMRGEPWSFAVGAVATISEAQMRMEYVDPLAEEDEAAWSAAEAIVTGITGAFLDRTFMTGLQDFSMAVAEPGRYMRNFLTRTASSAMPLSSFRRQMDKVADPYLREAITASEKFNRTPWIPGSNDQLPYKRDLFGRPIVYDQGLLGPLSPFPASEPDDSPVARELSRLMLTTQRPAISMPQRRILGLRLNAEQYSRYVEMARATPMGGVSFYEAVNKIVTDSGYWSTQLSDEARIELLRNTQRQYDEAARQQMMATTPELQARHIQQERVRQQLGID
jgi:hypothetical protein